jgi:hypothetical protein
MGLGLALGLGLFVLSGWVLRRGEGACAWAWAVERCVGVA